MTRKTTLCPAEPVCREAVGLLVERLVRSTDLGPCLRDGSGDDITFEGGAELCVEWPDYAQGADGPLEDWEQEDEQERADAGRGAVELYAATLEALSRDPEAARVLVGLLRPETVSGGPRTTGGLSAGPQGGAWRERDERRADARRDARRGGDFRGQRS